MLEDTYTGVGNPYTMAELIVGRRINWKGIKKRKEMLESIFGMPYREILNPESGSPIFATLNLKEQNLDEIKDLDEIETVLPKNDREAASNLTDIRQIGDLGNILKVENVHDINVENVEYVSSNTMRLEVKVPQGEGTIVKPLVIPQHLLPLIVPQKTIQSAVNEDWIPENGHWEDIGHFFSEVAEFSDPIQGPLGNCYLIAAMASVAWARPYDIVHRTRATGYGQQEFTNMIVIYDDNGTVNNIEVTESIAVSNVTNAAIYCRSSEQNEIWPAIYEKAYAKWLTGTTSDHPDITQTAGGSVYLAMQRLTGLNEWHVNTKNYTLDDLWLMVKENSVGKRTFNPMGAATISEYMMQQEGLTFIGSGIAGGHAYSILGWDYVNGTKYIIFRNPWGFQETSVGAMSGSVSMYNISWWQNIDLTDPDGVFGIDVKSFQKYFRYIGGVKET